MKLNKHKMHTYITRKNTTLNKFITVQGFLLKSMGNQTVLHRFWPFFKILAPVAIGYLAFGTILEQNATGYDYESWVLTGLIVWFPISGMLTFSTNLLSNQLRRLRINSPLVSVRIMIQSILFPNYIMAIFASILLALNQDSFLLGFSSIAKSVFFLILISPLIVMLTYFLGLLSALARDIRMLIPFLSQFLLLTSPIFYSPRTPNSKVESFVEFVNPLNGLLNVFRSLQLDQSINVALVLTLFCSVNILYYIFLRQVGYATTFLNHTLTKSSFIEGDEE
jgi:ABC-type polysaccharide/polyol phosphate export permease